LRPETGGRATVAGITNAIPNAIYIPSTRAFAFAFSLAFAIAIALAIAIAIAIASAICYCYCAFPDLEVQGTRSTAPERAADTPAYGGA
jgi:hypothetical protein